MNNIYIALIIGISAAIVEVVPIIIQRIDKAACISAAIKWIVPGMIISFVNRETQS